MSEFPQTWYRPSRYSDKDLLDTLIVHGETAQMISVEEKSWHGDTTTIRRQYKAGAHPTRQEALAEMLEQAKRDEQTANDLYSRKVQRRKRIEAAFAEESK